MRGTETMRVTLTFGHNDGVHVVSGERQAKKYNPGLFMEIAMELQREAEILIGAPLTLLSSRVSDVKVSTS
jgi:hypothetical protein